MASGEVVGGFVLVEGVDPGVALFGEGEPFDFGVVLLFLFVDEDGEVFVGFVVRRILNAGIQVGEDAGTQMLDERQGFFVVD